ncbi:MAG: hypothetical protein AVDCRST_MAG27-2829 [uncultured Craurococcus sp.]|uniref:Uncharacterized protein n=1 Tax=uncultured Craurococcus sp. TaxID=1135998 RepID=A0A6J4IZ06_9PROT|nr:MAG: hypothetical protein AVDCRST_MAG27-2829 [uncultured Craurococcus sp.]
MPPYRPVKTGIVSYRPIVTEASLPCHASGPWRFTRPLPLGISRPPAARARAAHRQGSGRA